MSALSESLRPFKDVLADTSLSFKEQCFRIAGLLDVDFFHLAYFDPVRGVHTVESRPSAWVKRYNQLGYILRDKVVDFAMKNQNFISSDVPEPSLVGATFDELLMDSDFGPAKIFGEAREFGLKAGYGLSFKLTRLHGGIVHYYSVNEKAFHRSILMNRALFSEVGRLVFIKFHDQVRQSDRPELSGREREVLTLVAEGLTTDVISTLLNISHRTVDAHVQAAGAKLGTVNRVAACVRAVQCGLIVPNFGFLPND